MRTKHDSILRAALLEYCKLKSWTKPHAVTLTLRDWRLEGDIWRRLTKPDAQQNLRHFLNVLQKQSARHGLTKTTKLQRVPVLEGEENKHRPHYHLMLDNPASIDTPTYRAIIQHAWQRTFWGHQRVTVDPCQDSQGWLAYITKLRTKESYADSIDWMNFL